MREVANKLQAVLLATLVKLNGMVVPTGALMEFAFQSVDALTSVISSINQVAVDGTLEVNKGSGMEMLKTFIKDYNNLPRITKEQFYDLSN